MNKGNFIEKLNWKRCKKATPKNNSDVSISLHKGNKQCDRICIIFRNEIFKDFNNKKISVAVWKDRVLFRIDDEGYKVSHYTQSPHGYIKFTITDIQELKNFIGDYKVEFDDFYEMYYVKKEERK